jgi:hypothetical protein
VIASAPSLLASVSQVARQTTGVDDDQERRAKLLLRGKGAVPAHRLVPPARCSVGRRPAVMTQRRARSRRAIALAGAGLRALSRLHRLRGLRRGDHQPGDCQGREERRSSPRTSDTSTTRKHRPRLVSPAQWFSATMAFTHTTAEAAARAARPAVAGSLPRGWSGGARRLARCSLRLPAQLSHMVRECCFG